METEQNQYFFLINSLRLGGAEKNCVNLANGLTHKGYKVSIIVLELRDAVLVKSLMPEVGVINLNISNARKSIFALSKIIDEFKIKQILVFTFQLAVVLVLIRKIWKKNFRIIARSINSLEEKYKHEKSIWHKWVSQFMVKKWFFDVDHIIAQSTGMKLELEKLKGDNEVPITVVFNFIEKLPSFTNSPKQSQDKICLFVGKLKQQKNLFFLIDAFAKIVKDRSAVKLWIVGEGELKQNLENRILNLGLQNDIILKGKSQNVAEYYRLADLCLLSSHYEGFPNVLIEANAFGVPVVSLDCPSGPSDIIIQDINGILVKEGTLEAYSSAILSALSKEWNPVQIKKSVERFSKEKALNAYFEILNPKQA